MRHAVLEQVRVFPNGGGGAYFRTLLIHFIPLLARHEYRVRTGPGNPRKSLNLKVLEFFNSEKKVCKNGIC